MYLRHCARTTIEADTPLMMGQKRTRDDSGRIIAAYQDRVSSHVHTTTHDVWIRSGEMQLCYICGPGYSVIHYVSQLFYGIFTSASQPTGEPK